MRNPEQEAVVKQAIGTTNDAGNVLCKAATRASDNGKRILKGSHVYLYAALLADFVTAAKQSNWIGPAIRMPDLTIKPTEHVLMDHFFDTVFKPLFKRGGEEFLYEVKRKATALIASGERP